MAYDPKCLELAAYFLEEDSTLSEKIIAKLAERLQDVIEDFMQDDDNFVPQRADNYDDYADLHEQRHQAMIDMRLK
jgi:hypothetical protein